METFAIKHLTFTYPKKENAVLLDIDIKIKQGEFVILCGKSGCGKSTLLRHLKSTLAPFGEINGTILFEGVPLSEVDQREQSQKIGFVQQSPDNQIVTDKVWHELAFGLESLGYSTPKIRAEVAEMASFFGIQTWFHKSVNELSGGQKQLLNLAAIMVLKPSILILDEPTSQLDPIASTEFLETIAKVNRELGTTIILTEHRLEEALPLSDRVIVMDSGKIIADASPEKVGEHLRNINHDMFLAMPTPMRVYAGVENDLTCPITVRDGRKWLEEFSKTKDNALNEDVIPTDNKDTSKTNLTPIIELEEIWFRYDKNANDVVKGLATKIYEGELFSIVGGNGTGKTTSLSIMTGILKPYRGQVKINGRLLGDISDNERYNGLLGVLPQNPQALFVKKTVEMDLYEMFSGRKLSKDEQYRRVVEVSKLCELDDLLMSHPYDLSGGEQQRAALAKVLLLTPRILFLDEPTKGLDGHFKEKLSNILIRLKETGVTIVMVSHDIEFCASYADRCAMFFDGNIVSEGTPREFFSGKSFYTTSANRMARSLLPKAVIAQDIIAACGGSIQKASKISDINTQQFNGYKGIFEETISDEDTKKKVKLKNRSKAKLTPARITVASICFVLFTLTVICKPPEWVDWRQYIVHIALVLEIAIGFFAIFPGRQLDSTSYMTQTPSEKRRLSKRTLVAMVMILIAIPLTIFVGVTFLGDRKYYFISMLIIIETMIPFMLVFEKRKPQARELVVISVLCALGVAGRAAFFMLPQFKPVVAIVIISGVCFGGETGFLVGAVTGLISNFFFSQGPWTPWQMFAFGIIGFLAGILFRKGLLQKRRMSLCIFGGLTTFFIYGGIMNPAAVIMWQAKPTVEMFISSYLMGIPFDLIHAFSTVFFLWFISAPMIEKLDRIKLKYGLLE